MRFPYRREPSSPSAAHPDRSSVLRPRIRARLKHHERSVDLLALVDSGADDCLFPFEVAEMLGVVLHPAKSHHYGGIGEGVIVASFETVTLEVGGWSLPLYAGFSDAPSIIPILGQNGFFTSFEVAFNRAKEVLELKPIRKYVNATL